MESEVEIGKSSMQHNIYGGLNPPRCHSMEELVPFGSDGKKMALILGKIILSFKKEENRQAPCI